VQLTKWLRAAAYSLHAVLTDVQLSGERAGHDDDEKSRAVLKNSGAEAAVVGSLLKL